MSAGVHRTALKVCCIADTDEARMALSAGAAALGLVSPMPSGPGAIDERRAAVVAKAMRGLPVKTFLLTARTTAAGIAAQWRQVRPTTLQLVDHVPRSELRALRDLCPRVELVQVVHVLGEASLAEALAVAPEVDAILLDSGNPQAVIKELGGTGRTHDWALSRRIRDAVFPLPLWLAGGLNAGNVGAAVAAVQPHGVDLCSSLRTEGRLDASRLAAFALALSAAAVPDGP
ncbi:MAG: phosphoribosylanthranilate isomerase [Rubrivivax sp.]